MPCYVTGSAAGDAQLYAEEARQEAQEATRAACDMARVIRSSSLAWAQLSLNTQNWIRAHEELDKKRRKPKQHKPLCYSCSKDGELWRCKGRTQVAKCSSCGRKCLCRKT
jgi:hypothetical protein